MLLKNYRSDSALDTSIGKEIFRTTRTQFCLHGIGTLSHDEGVETPNVLVEILLAIYIAGDFLFPDDPGGVGISGVHWHGKPWLRQLRDDKPDVGTVGVISYRISGQDLNGVSVVVGAIAIRAFKIASVESLHLPCECGGGNRDS